jgi:prefoldin alpha subunit
MSEKGGEERKVVAVDLNQLYALTVAIKEELEGLQAVHAQLSSLYERIRKAKESIDAIALSKEEESFLLPLEPGALVLSKMTPLDKDNFIVNIGLDVYVKLSASEAQRVLSARESEVLRRLEEVSKRISELSQAYEQYQALLQAAASAMEAQRKGSSSSR